MRFTAVLDATAGAVEQQARALAGFLRAGLVGDLSGETLVFHDGRGDRERLVALSPTRDVRLVAAGPRAPERIVEILAASLRDEGVSARGAASSLFLFAGGAAGTELAACLARRAGGGAFTDALSIEAGPDRIAGRRNVYSNHLVGRFELVGRPCCVSVDPSWKDEPGAVVAEHRMLSDSVAAGRPDHAPLEDVELEALPSSDDLAASRFLVVAGRGAGSRRGVERIAAAARLMGADFGISRPVAMNAWAPTDRLIGVSGTRAAPALCVVVGASGAPGLYWGIEKAGFIVAINPDPEAPIVENADTALLDDGVATIEELAKVVAAHRRRE